MGIRENIEKVRAEIAAVCRRCGRDPSEITLIGVSKFQPAGAVREAAAAGLADLAENYVQEWRKKSEELSGVPVRWHFIGHLQSNKVKYLTGQVALIHSVDSVSLIDEIAKQSARKQVRQEILLELNLSGDPGKTGAPEGRLPELMEACRRHEKDLVIRGFMCMGPLDDDAEAARPVFRRLKEIGLGSNIGKTGSPLVLSMGMSGDFEVAIEEGATHIRIGTALFGPRPAKPAPE